MSEFQRKLEELRRSKEEETGTSEEETEFQRNLRQYRESQASRNLESQIERIIDPTPVADPTPDPEKRGNFVTRNLDIPLGMGGAAAGAAAGGMVAGPPGALVGMVAGGALGTGAGTVMSEMEYGSGDPVTAYRNAVEAALWSAGLDLATFGLGTKIKGAWFAARMREGRSVEEAAMDVIDIVHPAGSPESLAATQRILNRRGATLLPSQVLEGGLDGFRERIASVGLVSRTRMEDNIRAVNDALIDEFNDLINKNASGMAEDAYNMGSVFSSLLDEGRETLSKQYGMGLNDIQRSLSTAAYATVDSRYITKPVDDYLKTITGEAADKVDTQTLKFIRGSIQRLKNIKSGQVKVSELIDIDRNFTDRMNTLYGPRGSTPNEKIHFELTEAAQVIRGAIQNTLERVDPDAAAKYVALKDGYSEAINTMFPKINAAFVTQAKNSAYTGLGSIAAKATRVENVKALKASLAQAIATAKKSGEDVGFESFEQVNKLIKEGFLTSKLKKIMNTEKGNVFKLKDVALSLQDPTQAKIYKEVLGEDFPRFKQLTNAVLETAESATGETGVLLLRGLEAKGLKGLAQFLTLGTPVGGAAVASGAGAAASLVGAGAAALYVPHIFSKVVTNPQYVNRLITVLKSGKKDRASAEIAMNIIVSEAIDEMTDYEKAAAKEYVENLLLQKAAPLEAERLREEQRQAPPPPPTRTQATPPALRGMLL